jgi:hypothetical protein
LQRRQHESMSMHESSCRFDSKAMNVLAHAQLTGNTFSKNMFDYVNKGKYVSG